MTDPSLFGILILDRNPLGLENLPGLLQVWLQDAGGFAAAGLVAYLLYALTAPADQPESARTRMPLTTFMLGMAALSLLCYAGYVALWAAGIGAEPPKPPPQPGESWKYEPPVFWVKGQSLLLMFGGLFALLGIGQPFARDLLKLRFRRIWALSKVGFKEAVRSRLFWVFLIFLLPFLFPAQWFIRIKPEDELRLTVDVTSFSTTLLLMVPALILAAFSIPNDIKNQTIYTVVTKPVERFEIVLGRFFGYTFLMSLALAGMSLFGLLLISGSSLDPKAKEETYKARVPVRGQLAFRSKAELRGEKFEGTNVGREFEYRKYIAGHPNTGERAVWSFADVPAALADPNRPNQAVPCEFTFDIFRLTKGDENKGVFVNLRFVTHQAEQVPPADRSGVWQWADAEKGRQYEKDRAGLERELNQSLAYVKPGSPGWAKVNDLARKYGFYEVASEEVYDYHPSSVPVPAGLFQNAREGDPKDKPRFQVYVKCLSPGQMLGMAEGDLYLLAGDQSFGLNYFKNAFGLWCRVALVIGVAVALSTYLSGVISLLGTAFLYVSAYFAEHLRDVATGQSVGGGPFESLTRLLRTDTPTAQLEQSAAVRTAGYADAAYAWLFRRFANIVPDVDAFTWTNFLKEGFNISFEYLVLNLILLVGYLLPWGLLAYYLIRNREVAA